MNSPGSMSYGQKKFQIDISKEGMGDKNDKLWGGHFGQKGWEFIDVSKKLKSPPTKLGGRKSFNPYMLSLHK